MKDKFITLENLSGYSSKTDEKIREFVNDKISEVIHPEYTLIKKDTADKGYISSYNLTKNGEVVGSTINIPKDYLVKSATLETVTVADTPVEGYIVGDKYINFVINTVQGDGNATHIYLLVSELLDTCNIEDIYNRCTGGKNILKILDFESEKNGVKVVGKADGSITVNGTSTSPSQTDIGIKHLIDNKGLPFVCQNDMIFSLKCDNKDGFYVIQYKNDVETNDKWVNIKNNYSFTMKSGWTVKRIYFAIYAGTTTDYICYPMVRYADITDDTYVPYVPTNKEIQSEIDDILKRLTALEGGA